MKIPYIISFQNFVLPHLKRGMLQIACEISEQTQHEQMIVYA